MRTGFLHQWPRRGLMGLVRGYRFFLSPWLGSSCRFEPTCSAYALEALAQHGAAVGVRLTAGRLLRCHPWCAGGHDPVPVQVQGLFTRLSMSPAEPSGSHAAPTTSPSSLKKISP